MATTTSVLVLVCILVCILVCTHDARVVRYGSASSRDFHNAAGRGTRRVDRRWVLWAARHCGCATNWSRPALLTRRSRRPWVVVVVECSQRSNAEHLLFRIPIRVLLSFRFLPAIPIHTDVRSMVRYCKHKHANQAVKSS